MVLAEAAKGKSDSTIRVTGISGWCAEQGEFFMALSEVFSRSKTPVLGGDAASMHGSDPEPESIVLTNFLLL